MRRQPPIPIDSRYGAWLVICSYMTGCRVRCDCGYERIIPNHKLRSGSMGCKSCALVKVHTGNIGKIERKVARDTPTDTFRRLRMVVDNAVYRCTNPNAKQWKDYGGRGITICKEWLENRDLFLLHLLTLPGHDNPKLVIDRVKNSVGYQPGNMRFVTSSVSNFNRRPFNPHVNK